MSELRRNEKGVWMDGNTSVCRKVEIEFANRFDDLAGCKTRITALVGVGSKTINNALDQAAANAVREKFEHLVPDGWEFVDVRAPKQGEHYVTSEGGVSEAMWDVQAVSAIFVIVRKKHDPRDWWPKWVTARYLAVNKNLHGWWAFNKKPPRFFTEWEDVGCYIDVRFVNADFPEVKLEKQGESAVFENPYWNGCVFVE